MGNNNLNYLSNIIDISEQYNKSSIDTLELVEQQVTKYMFREKYQGNLLTPPKKYYDRAVNIIERFYKQNELV